LRIKSLQQGEDDGVPYSQGKEEGPKIRIWPNASSKVQEMVQIFQNNQIVATGLNN